MEPIPETDEALDEYLEEDGSDLRERLSQMAGLAVGVVPSCVGLSLELLREGLTFTLVASPEELARLGMAHHLEGDPRGDVAPTGARLDAGLEAGHEDLLDEARWSDFACTSAAEGVQSTLTLLLMQGPFLAGAIDLYAARSHAFVDKHEALAVALGAVAEGAVSDADLGFSTRVLARQAPATLADARTVDLAIGVLAAMQHVDVEIAQEQLEEAARRSGVTLAQVASLVNGIRVW